MKLPKKDREELIKYAKALGDFSNTVSQQKRNITAILSGPLPPMEVDLLFQRIERQDKTAGEQLRESYTRLIEAADYNRFLRNNPAEDIALIPSREFVGKVKYEANQLSALMTEIAKEQPTGGGKAEDMTQTTPEKGIAEDKWYRNRTIQGSLIGAVVLIFVSAIGWFLNSHSNKQSVSLQKNSSISSESKTISDSSPAINNILHLPYFGTLTASPKMIKNKLATNPHLNPKLCANPIRQRAETKTQIRQLTIHSVYIISTGKQGLSHGTVFKRHCP